MSTIAVFVAFGGGAYAAAGNPFVGKGGTIQGCVKNGTLDVARAGKGCPKHSTRLSFGEVGPRGNQGIQGAQGTPGVQGTPGIQGIQGVPGPLLTQLPSGKSETGTYEAGSDLAMADEAWGSISFPIPLADAPTPNIVLAGGSPTAACPGSVTSPTAAAGDLCLYEGSDNNRFAAKFLNPENDALGQATRFGAVLLVDPGSTAGNLFSMGTWAVTAP
jgi:ribosomal protein S18 acetylase RimI-like enzyme